jgi:hypothetical protein
MVLAALPAVLLQDSGAPPAATPSHVQRPSSPPTATLACTQGHPEGGSREGSGGRALCPPLSLSPSRDALVTPTASGTPSAG